MTLGRNPLPAVLLATFISGFGFSVVVPVSSVVLEEMHVATPIIGLVATIMFAGFAVGGPLSGRCIRLYGIRRTVAAGLVGSGLMLALIGLKVWLPLWFVLRFILGIAAATAFTSAEILINRVSTDANRGRNLGLYGFAFSLSMMIGPFALWLLRFGVWLPFLLAGLFCIAMAPVVYAAIPEYKEEPKQLKIDFHFVRRVRVSMVAMLMAGFMEGALIALIPVYALREGFTEPQTGLLLSAFMIGHGSFPPLIGILGDRIGLRRVLLITYALGAISFSAMLLMPVSMAISVVLALGGAAVGALYPLAVGLLAGVLSFDELPRGNALTTFCYGMGSIAGPFIPAVIMHVSRPGSLFIVAAVLYGAVFAFTRRSLAGKV
jgi:MFS family permease